MNASPRTLLAGTLALALVLAACGGAASSPVPSPAPSAGPSQPGATLPTPVPVPGGSAGSGGATDPGQGGGSAPGNPGGGPVPIDPGAGGGPVNPGDPTRVAPVAGARNIHDVPATRLRAAVNGRNVAIEIAWWSGVEPCSVFAGVIVDQDGSTLTLTVREGSAAGPDVACIEIAMFKATIADLGELAPGTYTVRAFGDAAPIQVVVAG